MTIREVSEFNYERVMMTGLLIFLSSLGLVLLGLSGYSFILTSAGSRMLSIVELAERFCCWPLALSEIILAFTIMFWMNRHQVMSGSLFGGLAGFSAGIASVLLKTALGFHVGIYGMLFVAAITGAGILGSQTGKLVRNKPLFEQSKSTFESSGTTP